MLQTLYGYRWNSTMRFMRDVIPEDEAKLRYADGPWFSVAVGEGLATSPEESRAAATARIEFPVPEFVVELEAGAAVAKTFFFDEWGSIEAIYAFDRVENRLFLSSVTFYTYPDELRFFGQNESLRIEWVDFTTDGISRHHIDDRSQPTIEVIDRRNVDLTKHWEPIPVFGDWASIGRLDRRAPDVIAAEAAERDSGAKPGSP